MRSALRQPRFWVGLAVSFAAIWFAVRGVSWDALTDALARADYRWLVPGVAAIVAGQAARAWRWRALFGGSVRPALTPAFQILSVGYMVSAVFPLRLGDPLRAWLVETRTPADGAVALATVMVERAVDFLMIALLVAVIVPAYAAEMLTDELGRGPWSEPMGLSALAVSFVLAVYAAMVAASAVGGRLARFVTTAARRIGASESVARRLGYAAARFASGFAPLRQPGHLGHVLSWTLVVWLLGATSNWVFLRAFVPDASFGAAMVVLGTTALFAVLPSSPGYVGVFHSAVVLAMAAIGGVARETALAYAIVLHGVTIATLLVLGVLCLWALGLSGSELGRRLQSAQAVGARYTADQSGSS